MNSESTASAEPNAALATSDATRNDAARQRWWRLADVGVLGIWIAVVGITLQHHEKWADEAQAWLLARDLDLRTLWFKELRYEGTPGLWHTILWMAQHWFHAPYAAVGPIGMACATAGVAFMLWKAPFPRPLRYLLAFSYFMVYQYAVIARPYTLFPLLGFAAACNFKDVKHPERITIALVLLANLTAHGALLAACLGVAYVIEVVKAWPTLEEQTRVRFMLAAAVMLLAFLFLFVVLNPPADVEGLQRTQPRTLFEEASKMWQGVTGAFFDSTAVTLVWLALGVVWCWLRKRPIVLILPVAALGIFYSVVNGWAHQQGTIFLAAIIGLWIAWPTQKEEMAFSPRERWTHLAMIVALICLFSYQIWNAAGIIRNDYRYPYCGAEDTAKYLKSVGADRQPIVGYLYGMVAVQAYFDHNILANLPTAYAHHGLPFRGVKLDLKELEGLAPEYVVFTAWEDPENTLNGVYAPFMSAAGYSLVHVSDGYLLWKRSWELRQVYFVFRRN
jgi:hypothetical protein